MLKVKAKRKLLKIFDHKYIYFFKNEQTSQRISQKINEGNYST